METDTSISIRDGGPDDIPAILGMFDSAVAWLVAQGRTGQWGTKPWSENPKAVAMVERYVAEGSPFIAEVDGVPAGTLTLTDSPGSYIKAVDEPERYVHLLASDRQFKGYGVGSALLAHAAEVTRRAGISLLRVDCYAGDDRKLVAYYESNGFTATEAFTVGDDKWPGQVLARRV
ncbi:GNAT family N-acetyltransferase [Streptomyces sp. W16]|uniref:GNAT family N-acetyltransferase n=1 Tax=Streptomyces sp. W16 TaxID=3076631 RepID=UPI00295B1136|nr:GNAT family N-acetyltransferase [Streptomyces sp. W16]MDV9169739.1 GNAT family N-acetyltransferase [Streptomyces sp. W16]